MNVQVTLPNGSHTNYNLEGVPNECPHCHRSISPNRKNSYVVDSEIQGIFQCPNENCHMIFIGFYHLRQSPTVYYYYKNSAGTIKHRQFNDDIANLSTGFVDIYNQAVEAEFRNLEHIAGMGFRKAFEFLIKDYLISKNQDKEEKIRTKFLGACIKEMVDSPSIKDMAERTVWLGNDETHYVRKWETKDINDLKKLIDITLHWIEMEILTEKYKNEMS
ncbi:MAG TPA: DUF4145 domain-containing protein [Flavipsychrobacter sp.]|nr:DUF4145 domain-containing protein [Flavipsychrobacter sp.]